MADPVASVETIVRIALAISEAVGTAQRNIDQCKDVQTQVSIAKDSLLVQQKKVRNIKYSILLVMSELSTVRCDRALGL